MAEGHPIVIPEETQQMPRDQKCYDHLDCECYLHPDDNPILKRQHTELQPTDQKWCLNCQGDFVHFDDECHLNNINAVSNNTCHSSYFEEKRIPVLKPLRTLVNPHALGNENILSDQKNSFEETMPVVPVDENLFDKVIGTELQPMDQRWCLNCPGDLVHLDYECPLNNINVVPNTCPSNKEDQSCIEEEIIEDHLDCESHSQNEQEQPSISQSPTNIINPNEIICSHPTDSPQETKLISPNMNPADGGSFVKVGKIELQATDQSASQSPTIIIDDADEIICSRKTNSPQRTKPISGNRNSADGGSFVKMMGIKLQPMDQRFKRRKDHQNCENQSQNERLRPSASHPQVVIIDDVDEIVYSHMTNSIKKTKPISQTKNSADGGSFVRTVGIKIQPMDQRSKRRKDHLDCESYSQNSRKLLSAAEPPTIIIDDADEIICSYKANSSQKTRPVSRNKNLAAEGSFVKVGGIELQPTDVRFKKRKDHLDCESHSQNGRNQPSGSQPPTIIIDDVDEIICTHKTRSLQKTKPRNKNPADGDSFVNAMGTELQPIDQRSKKRNRKKRKDHLDRESHSKKRKRKDRKDYEYHSQNRREQPSASQPPTIIIDVDEIICTHQTDSPQETKAISRNNNPADGDSKKRKKKEKYHVDRESHSEKRKRKSRKDHLDHESHSRERKRKRRKGHVDHESHSRVSKRKDHLERESRSRERKGRNYHLDRESSSRERKRREKKDHLNYECYSQNEREQLSAAQPPRIVIDIDEIISANQTDSPQETKSMSRNKHPTYGSFASFVKMMEPELQLMDQRSKQRKSKERRDHQDHKSHSQNGREFSSALYIKETNGDCFGEEMIPLLRPQRQPVPADLHRNRHIWSYQTSSPREILLPPPYRKTTLPAVKQPWSEPLNPILSRSENIRSNQNSPLEPTNQTKPKKKSKSERKLQRQQVLTNIEANKKKKAKPFIFSTFDTAGRRHVWTLHTNSIQEQIIPKDKNLKSTNIEGSVIEETATQSLPTTSQGNLTNLNKLCPSSPPKETKLLSQEINPPNRTPLIRGKKIHPTNFLQEMKLESISSDEGSSITEERSAEQPTDQKCQNLHSATTGRPTFACPTENRPEMASTSQTINKEDAWVKKKIVPFVLPQATFVTPNSLENKSIFSKRAVPSSSHCNPIATEDPEPVSSIEEPNFTAAEILLAELASSFRQSWQNHIKLPSYKKVLCRPDMQVGLYQSPKKHLCVDQSEMENFLMNMPYTVIKEFIEKELAELEATSSYNPTDLEERLIKYDQLSQSRKSLITQGREVLNSQILKEKRLWNRILNMFIFGVHKLQAGKYHLHKLKSFLADTQANKTPARRMILLTSYCYIFSKEKHKNVNYYDQIRHLIQVHKNKHKP